MAFAELLKQCRKQQGMSQADLASKLRSPSRLWASGRGKSSRTRPPWPRSQSC